MGSEAPGEGAEVASVASDGPAVDGTLDGRPGDHEEEEAPKLVEEIRRKIRPP